MQSKLEKSCEQRILCSLRQITHAIDSYSRRLRAEQQITVPQLVCLQCIVENGPITISSIGKHVYLSNSTLVGIVDRLEEKGYIARERNKLDRRQVNISATEEGVEAVGNAPSPLQEKLAKSLAALPELEQTAIALSLERVVGLMDISAQEKVPMLETGTEQGLE